MLAQSFKIDKNLPEDFRSEPSLRKPWIVSPLFDAQQKLVSDAGCGNGRVRYPLAHFFPTLDKFILIEAIKA